MENRPTSGGSSTESKITSFKENIKRFFGTVTLQQFPKFSYIIVTVSLLVNLSEDGLISIMTIYFQTLFYLEPSEVTIALHLYNFGKYFAVLFGAVLADSYFGRVTLVIYGLSIFFIGNTLLAISSTLRMAFPSRFVLFLALFAKVIGPGLILPCLIPLAADQISEDSTYEDMKAFFVFYFVMSQVGEFIAKITLPLILQLSCFNLDSCYPIAFGIPAILSSLAVVIFCCIRKKCVQLKPHQPVVIQGLQCCWHALRMKIKKRKNEKREHWLDFSDDRYDVNFIKDIKGTIQVLFIPIPLYWSLYDQQWTTWTMQASRLETEIFPNFRIMPEQAQALGPFFFLLLIPIFHFFVYDLLYPFRFLRTLLKRMVTGGFLIAMAFVMAYNLELRIEFSYPNLPKSGVAYIYVFNGLTQDVSIRLENKITIIKSHSESQLKANLKEDSIKYRGTLHYGHRTIHTSIVASKQEAVSYALVGPEPRVQLVRIGTKPDNNYKESIGRVRLRLICTDKEYCGKEMLKFYPSTWYIQRPTIVEIPKVKHFTELKMLSGKYDVHTIFNKVLFKKALNLVSGGVYTLMVSINKDQLMMNLFEITPPNKISIMWMIPQYLVLSVSAVFFKISAFSFIYTETPDQMKSLSWSICYMTISTGNIITVIFGGSGKPSTSFLIFSIAMFLFMILFLQTSTSYKYKHKYPVKPSLNKRKSILNIF